MRINVMGLCFGLCLCLTACRVPASHETLAPSTTVSTTKETGTTLSSTTTGTTLRSENPRPTNRGPAPAAYQLTDVPLIAQFPQYPTGCESVTAVMALQYAGQTITVDDFVDQCLTTSNAFYWENGLFYGPDPWKTFAGHPRSKASYGCMAPVIKQAIDRWYGESGRVLDLTGTSLSDLCEQQVAAGRPVMVWATIYMEKVVPTATWITPTGKEYTWPGNEHCMLLVGYDEERYYFHDPYSGKALSWRRALVEDRYDRMGSQALVIL